MLYQLLDLYVITTGSRTAGGLPSDAHPPAAARAAGYAAGAIAALVPRHADSSTQIHVTLPMVQEPWPAALQPATHHLKAVLGGVGALVLNVIAANGGTHAGVVAVVVIATAALVAAPAATAAATPAAPAVERHEQVPFQVGLIDSGLTLSSHLPPTYQTCYTFALRCIMNTLCNCCIVHFDTEGITQHLYTLVPLSNAPN